MFLFILQLSPSFHAFNMTSLNGSKHMWFQPSFKALLIRLLKSHQSWVIYKTTQQSDVKQTELLFKNHWIHMMSLAEHLDCSWAVSHYSLFFSEPMAMQMRMAHLDTAYLSMESTISSMQPFILFCASKWVMFSVGSPSMERIISPMHRFAWAALLPGLTYNTGHRNYKIRSHLCTIITNIWKTHLLITA